MIGIEAKRLMKSYGDVQALSDVSLSFSGAKIYGLLGRNGAGKTTLLNSITGRIFVDEGEIFIDGERAVENDRTQGKIFMMGEMNLYPDRMKVKEALKWMKVFYPNFDREYFEIMSGKFGLNINKKIKSLSTGYGSIFRLLLALSSNVPYLIFDEPVLGLDANHRDLFYKVLLEKYIDRPFTAIISTHLIEEVASVIEEVVIINKGKIIQIQTTEELLRKGCSISGSASAVEEFIRGKNILGIDSLGGFRTAYLIDDIDPNTIPKEIEMGKMDLQKLFIHMTNDRETNYMKSIGF
jgi:ABC-2 type transport system ATP-binding protein